MKTTRFLQVGGLLVALIISLTSCNQAQDERNKHFTPLFVYFDPMGLDMKVESLMPYFVNYPTDWAKMGLKHYPMRVTYNAFHPTWKVSLYSEYVFFANGSLSEQSRTVFRYNANGPDIISFEYDDNANLKRILSEQAGFKNKYVDDGFTYDVDGRLVRRDKKGQGRYSAFTFYYMYHDNGALKAILPEKEDGSVYEGGVTLGRMDFDSLAHLVRLETPYSSNLFLEDLNKDKKGKSVVTYTYTDNLCTQAVEKIAVKFDEGTDTLVNVSSFMYNSHGDLVSWNYSGGVYKSKGNSWWVDHMKFTITYDYVYDEMGNWTQAKIILPTNIDEIPALRIYYKSRTGGYTSQDKSPCVASGEIPFLSVERTIDYWPENFAEAMRDSIVSKRAEK